MFEPMLDEFREEAAVTKRVLERVPADKLAWKPHAKSMSLGQLAMHIATVPGSLTKITWEDEFEISQANFNPPLPKDVKEIHAAFEQSVREVEECLKRMTEQLAQGHWRLMFRGKEISSKPRIRVLRSIMLNHWYHHRGQLSVYLR
jgi:uncharacterized damage-inducible protein DinB